MGKLPATKKETTLLTTASHWKGNWVKESERFSKASLKEVSNLHDELKCTLIESALAGLGQESTVFRICWRLSVCFLSNRNRRRTTLRLLASSLTSWSNSYCRIRSGLGFWFVFISLVQGLLKRFNLLYWGPASRCASLSAFSAFPKPPTVCCAVFQLVPVSPVFDSKTLCPPQVLI